MSNKRVTKKKKAVTNVSQEKQGAEGSEIFSSGGLKWVLPNITTSLIEQYSENALLAEPLKNLKDLIFTTYEDHPAPWVTIKDSDGDIDDDLSRQGQQIAKVCDFYNAHILALMDQELGGCSVWSPGWGNIDGVTGICPVELRNLPWNSFRELPAGFTDIYNDIMPGIVIDKATGKVRIFQTPDDQHRPIEIVQTDPLPSWMIVRDPTSPKPAGKPGCLPVVALITNYNYADKAWNQKMNRVAAPSIFPYVDRITANNKAYVDALGKRWGKDTCFIMTEGMDFKNPYLTESTTAEERLAWLKKRIDGFYNPSTFLQKDGNTIGGSDSGAASMINKRTVSTLSQLESGLGERLLQIWLDINGFVGYTPEVRYPRPEVQDDQQVLAEIAEANKNGHISVNEARQKYPNLDLEVLAPEEEARLQEQARIRTASQNPFASMGSGSPVGNIQNPVERTDVLTDTERQLLAATRECKENVKRIVKGKIEQSEPGIIQRVKNLFTPVNNTDEAGGRWVTINGAHIFIEDGETPEQALSDLKSGKRTYSGEWSSKSGIKFQYSAKEYLSDTTPSADGYKGTPSFEHEFTSSRAVTLTHPQLGEIHSDSPITIKKISTGDEGIEFIGAHAKGRTKIEALPSPEAMEAIKTYQRRKGASERATQKIRDSFAKKDEEYRKSKQYQAISGGLRPQKGNPEDWKDDY